MSNAKPVPLKIPISQIMVEKVHTISPAMTLGEVAELFVKFKISGAPIIDIGQKVISVFGEGALLRFAAKLGLNATILACLDELPDASHVITIKKDAEFSEAYKLFIKHNIHRIPVVDGNGRLLGLVTRSLIFRIFVEAHYDKKIAQ